MFCLSFCSYLLEVFNFYRLSSSYLRLFTLVGHPHTLLVEVEVLGRIWQRFFFSSEWRGTVASFSATRFFLLFQLLAPRHCASTPFFFP